ncbi:uncharacterized protein LOC108673684 [Hyalella azteca]|uniref:Uncharacterized protein LOC108673684 n=1 Tax=Hyalella azteca TaxID=294128 RepID=A0A979FF55_HYAAZ|nr:uncharacterized protein LOC108673684 [Hyalella azteca]
MWRWCLLLAALVNTRGAVGQGLVFPGSSDSPSLSCTITRTGQKGECKLFEDCPALISPVDGTLIEMQACGVSFGQLQFCCPSSAERLTEGKRLRISVPAPPNVPKREEVIGSTSLR